MRFVRDSKDDYGQVPVHCMRVWIRFVRDSVLR